MGADGAEVRGAALDVFEEEPPPEDHPLFALDNVILTPHSAGLSKEATIRMAISTAKNVLAGIDGKLDPAMVVNREVLRDQGLSGRCLPRAGSSACQPAVCQGSSLRA